MADKMSELESTLKEYENRIAYIADDRNWEDDVWNALICRDLLEDSLEQLSDEQQHRLMIADSRLVALHNRVGQVLPARVTHPRSRWWWFLNEGPDVRKRREAA